jgi:hypothetical protein
MCSMLADWLLENVILHNKPRVWLARLGRAVSQELFSIMIHTIVAKQFHTHTHTHQGQIQGSPLFKFPPPPFFNSPPPPFFSPLPLHTHTVQCSHIHPNYSTTISHGWPEWLYDDAHCMNYVGSLQNSIQQSWLMTCPMCPVLPHRSSVSTATLKWWLVPLQNSAGRVNSCTLVVVYSRTTIASSRDTTTLYFTTPGSVEAYIDKYM